MQPYQIDVDPADIDADGLADGNSSAGATVTLDGTLTSGGAFVSADSLGRRIIITDIGADDQSGATYTLVGTDADDNALLEAIAGPTASGSVTTTAYFATVSSITIASPVAASTVDIGTVDEVQTKIYFLDSRNRESAGLGVVVTGTVNYTIEETFRNLHKHGLATDNFVDIASLADKTASLGESATIGAYGIRVVFNTYSDGAEVQVDVSQP